MSDKSQYDFSQIEKKWQDSWKQEESFKTKDFSEKPKYYILDMFPYPSGNGLHVGHAEGYTATDIMARYKRMCGFNVLHPMGWDAFGLPAEQYAIKTGTHPEITTKTNIDNYRKQIKSLGFSTDWNREINTTDPKYYRWTQWIFLKLYEKGLAYESHEAVNWCPKLGTVLANEEVINGHSEVGGFPVEKKKLRQWVLKITEYAERLLTDLDDLDWPESTKEMQRNWIGKSSGAYVSFAIEGQSELSFEVFTTRPDTLFGASFCVLAPEHPLLEKIILEDKRKKVLDYIEKSKNKSDLERLGTEQEKTGLFTGAYALNPVNQKKLPIYVADYVLISYGTGAIMAVPGHDTRDHAFAKKHTLPIYRVLSGGPEKIEEEAHSGEGTLVNSEFLNGLNKEKAIEKISSWLEEKKLGKKAVNYRLRDWIFSRQRYWGEPFPILHTKDGLVKTLAEEELPLTLPSLEDYRPTEKGDPPLGRAKDWLKLEKNGEELSRETNIMPQWAGSCWYYLRYLDPHNDKQAWDPEKEKHWLPVDLYVGGVEHANLHLLYARFWHKVLYDLGYVSTKEPFKKLRHPGIVLGSNGEKMSKSKGNVVNPDEVIAEWGSDSLRLYEMFMGPLEQVKPWQTNGITGVHRFLKRFWRLVINEAGAISEKISQEEKESKDFLRALHKTLKKVSLDNENLHFNTAVAAQMELLNQAYKEKSLSQKSIEIMILMLAPYAPHMSEELWQRLGHSQDLSQHPWPQFDKSLTVDDMVTLSVMVSGKHRATITVSKSTSKEEVLLEAKKIPAVSKQLDNKTIRKEIFVAGKVINFVV